MQRALVRVRVEFESRDLSEVAAVGLPSKVADGCFEVDFDSSVDLDIDTTEQALLEASAPALRDALSSRLARVARDHALNNAGHGGRVVGLSPPYPVDGEAGRFQIPSYDVIAGGATIRTRDFFPTLHGKEQYLTKGFLEIALLEGTVDRSYRKTSAFINRIRRQVDEGTPATTLRDVTERAGTKIVDSWAVGSEGILAESGFSADGTSLRGLGSNGTENRDKRVQPDDFRHLRPSFSRANRGPWLFGRSVEPDSTRASGPNPVFRSITAQTPCPNASSFRRFVSLMNSMPRYWHGGDIIAGLPQP